MKTLIAIPCMDMLHADFVRSLLGLEIIGEVQYTFAQSSLIYDARNQLASVVLDGGFDRVLWLDSDMLFPSWTFRRLTEHLDAGKECVSGLYFGRRPPFGPIIYKDLRLEDVGEKWPMPRADAYEDFPEETIFPVRAFGFGCCMMTAALLRRVFDGCGSPFAPIAGYGEDLSFCIRAGDLGATLWCDSALKLGHVGVMTYTEESWRAAKEAAT